MAHRKKKDGTHYLEYSGFYAKTVHGTHRQFVVEGCQGSKNKHIFVYSKQPFCRTPWFPSYIFLVCFSGSLDQARLLK